MALEIIKQHNSGNIFVDEYLVTNREGTKKYGIKGLYSFLNNNGVHTSKSPEVINDLERYINYRETKKEIQFSKLSEEIKKIKISELFFEIGAYQ